MILKQILIYKTVNSCTWIARIPPHCPIYIFDYQSYDNAFLFKILFNLMFTWSLALIVSSSSSSSGFVEGRTRPARSQDPGFPSDICRFVPSRSKRSNSDSRSCRACKYWNIWNREFYSNFIVSAEFVYNNDLIPFYMFSTIRIENFKVVMKRFT